MSEGGQYYFGTVNFNNEYILNNKQYMLKVANKNYI